MKKLGEVESICPDCFKEGKIKKIPAEIVEENGKVWITKECEEHGKFKAIYFGDAKLYHRWMKYKVTGKGPKNINIKSTLPPAPELFPEHLSQSILTNIMVTNRCNLRCSYCFMNAGAAGYVYEPSLQQIKEMMQEVRNEQPVPSMAVQLTGGEPTIREDLFEIIELAKEVGFIHVQLNTNGIKLAESVEYCKKLKQLDVNTVYMSFDGISKKANPWVEQQKKAVENLRKANLGVVLVPTVMADTNLQEMGEIIKYAAQNIDVVRGVNFQPISLCGRVEKIDDKMRKRKRVDYVKLFRALEKTFQGQLTREDFYPVPSVYYVSKFVENLGDEPQVELTANPGCGGATYVFVRDGKLIPITRFLDVEGILEFIKEQSQKSGLLKKQRVRFSLHRNATKYINEDKVPKGLNIKKLMTDALSKGSYEGLARFHENSLFIGTMWFQDIWNLNLERLKRCVIHYSTPEGIVPFCAYNGLNVGEKIRKKHGISVKEWEKKTGQKLKDDLWKGGPIS